MDAYFTFLVGNRTPTPLRTRSSLPAELETSSLKVPFPFYISKSFRWKSFDLAKRARFMEISCRVLWSQMFKLIIPNVIRLCIFFSFSVTSDFQLQLHLIAIFGRFF